MIVLDGIIRARHRNSVEKSELMRPGRIYEFEIDLWSRNTGKLPGADGKTKVATNTIYTDARHPSHIILPVVTR